MDDLVSIIIPVYNTPEEFLDICMNSIINQTYKNIEIIIIDDGSNKKIANKLDDYKNIDKRIKVIHQSNKGVSTARNFGIHVAKGKWLLFVDSDDYIKDSTVEQLLYHSKGYDIVISRVKLNIRDVPGYEKELEINKENAFELIKGILKTEDSFMTYVDGVWGKLYLKSFIEENKIKFCKELAFGEDAMFNIEAYLSAKTIKYIPDILYCWRKDNKSSTTCKYTPDLCEKLNKTICYLYNNFYDEIIVKHPQYYYEYIAATIKGIIINNIFNEENKENLIDKRKRLKQLKSSKYFEECIKKLKLKKMNKSKFFLIFALRYNLYFIIYLYIFIITTKNKIRNGENKWKKN